MQSKKTTFFIFILAFLILCAPPIIRLISYNNSPMGDIAYYNLRIAGEINKDPYFSADNLSYSGSDYIINPYHYLLAYSSFLLDANIFLLIFPIILGLLSLMLFYNICSLMKFKKEYSNLTCLIFIISPIFIYLFSYPNNDYLSFFLSLLIINLFLRPNKSWVLAVFPALLLPVLNISHVLPLFFILFFLTLYRKEMRSRLTILSAVLFLSALAYNVPLFIKYGWAARPDFIDKNIFNSFISDFGSLISFSIFSLLMSILGLIILDKKHETLPVFIGSGIALAFSYYFVTLRFYINFLLVFMVAYAILKLIKRRWKLNFLKNMTILAIVCGLLFSTISYTANISNSDPSNELVESMRWLKDQPYGVVLSHYSNGFWIETIAQKPTFMDSVFSPSVDFNARYKESELLFHSYRINEIDEIIKKNNIRYIWIDSRMKNGLVWEKGDEGLLLVLKSNPNFKKIYYLNDIEIWTYLG